MAVVAVLAPMALAGLTVQLGSGMGLVVGAWGGRTEVGIKATIA